MKHEEENEVTTQEETVQEEMPVSEAQPIEEKEKEKKDEQTPNSAGEDVRPKDKVAKKSGTR